MDADADDRSNKAPAPAVVDEIKEPSLAYQDSTASPVYRLSELMFGSLLAAYVLGFLGFGAGKAENITFYEVGTYLSISIAYAYVTSGLYVAYHAGILTMHHMPLGRLRWDFAVALSQAVAFGVSMINPAMFPFMLSLCLGASVWRHRFEHGEQTKSFHRELIVPETNSRSYRRDLTPEQMRFRNRFAKTLKEDGYGLLSGWQPVSDLALVLGVFLTLLGLASWMLISPLPGINLVLEVDEAAKPLVTFWVSVAVCLVSIYYVHGTLKQRAELLMNLPNMDKEFDAFMKKMGVRFTPARRVANSEGMRDN